MRKEQILDIGFKILEEKFLKNEQLILKEYFNNKNKILRKNADKINNLLNKSKCFAKDIKYISVLFLRSSLITKTYDFYFGLYDEKLYLDENILYTTLNLSFIFTYFEKDIDYFKENCNIYNLSSYEVYYLEQEYIKYYYKIAFKIFKDILIEVLKDCDFEDYKVIFGEYMGEFSEIEMR